MPEMPELENYRKLISEKILDAPITNVKVNKENTVNLDGDTLASELENIKVIFVERRGKFLNFHLDNGRRLLVNLMVGGYIQYGKQEDYPDHNAQVEISFGEFTLYFMLPRSGYVHLLCAKEAGEVLSQLGRELSDRRMGMDRFVNMVKVRRGALKTLLVNQSVIAGIGNRYADEISFEAKLLPSTKVQDLETEAIERLYHSMKLILNQAAESGGSINKPFTNEDLHTGSYKLQVYDREGERCVQCNGVIDKVELNGRRAFFCPTCQHEQ
ncbi:Fpg/Nei family DNA glycosylase [Paenibacillus sp. FA6]|uniref:Fpg/Nei family DNA glycosylase n=1 Tax=Paenibacillus sp. FA6 TaxID=3413029 RepID=UPI003F660487